MIDCGDTVRVTSWFTLVAASHCALPDCVAMIRQRPALFIVIVPVPPTLEQTVASAVV